MQTSTYDPEILDAVEIGLEYIIADRRTLQTRNIASAVLHRLSESKKESDPLPLIQISNTLVQHSLRFSNTLPASNFHKLEAAFLDSIEEVNQELEKNDAFLLPGGVHPFMDPKKEGYLYDIETHNPLISLARKIDYRRHSWLNRQISVFRIPYNTEGEFAQLHNALILLLPYIPALAASSPYLDGDWQEYLDERIYRQSRKVSKIPPIVGTFIPEACDTLEEYGKSVLNPIAESVADLIGSLPAKEVERINGRAAIALPSQKKIEIRILSTQEAPSMDLALIAFIIGALKSLLGLDPSDLKAVVARSTGEQRKEQLHLVCRRGYDATIELVETPSAFGLGNLPMPTQSFWKAVFNQLATTQPMEYGFDTIKWLLANGSLAQRLFGRYGKSLDNYAMNDMMLSLDRSLRTNSALLPA